MKELFKINPPLYKLNSNLYHAEYTKEGILNTVSILGSRFVKRKGLHGLKLVCNVNIVYRNLQSETSQNYAQKLNESVRS